MRKSQGGFTYVAMLFALAIFAVGLAAIGESWSTAAHREKEEELLRIGQAFERAIAEYYLMSPGNVKIYPHSLADLVEDRRFVGTVRHVRRIYIDPFTGNDKWGIVAAPNGGIAGVYSLSEKETLKKQNIVLRDGAIVGGARYSDWKFIYQPKS